MFLRRLLGVAAGQKSGPASITKALTTGDFDPLGQGKVAGRLQVHGIEIPRTEPGRIVAETERLLFREHPRLIVARKVSWRDVEFSAGKLPRVSLQWCSLQNVVFRECELTAWRFFSVRARECIFRDTNLHGAAFSVMTDDEKSTFRGCQFIRCDLGETAYRNASFEDCVFDHCRIAGVDFGGAAFTDVRFSGEISDAVFHGKRPNYTQVNPMLRVDFSAAQLRWVEFRSIDLASVRFPQGENQITIEDWPAFLVSVDALTAGREEMEFQQVRAMLGAWRKSCGPDQHRGFINLADIAAEIGPIAVEVIKAAIDESRH